jgi:flagellar biosynthesis/type III secretory pathway protein FliH
LHRIIKGKSRDKDNRCTVYFFPDISTDTPDPAWCDAERSFQPGTLGDHHPGGREGTEQGPMRGQGQQAGRGKTRQIEEQAYAHGFTKGEQEGIERGQKQFEPVFRGFQQALAELERVKKEIRFQAEKETVELALAIAKTVVCHEIHTNRSVVVNVIREALKNVVDLEHVKIRINPVDLALINGKEEQLLNPAGEIEKISFEEDDAIQRGGCVIETNFGDIDARIERQLRVVEETLKIELEQSAHSG